MQLVFYKIRTVDPGKNPEMTFSIERRSDLVFASCFWAFLPPVTVDYLLPVIFSDACGLFESFRGVLLVSLGLDANGKLLPLGFTISASEDLQSTTKKYEMFMEPDCPDLLFSLTGRRAWSLTRRWTIVGLIPSRGVWG